MQKLMCLFMISLLVTFQSIFASSYIAIASPPKTGNLKYPEFVPGEVIVKFKPSKVAKISKKIFDKEATDNRPLTTLFHKWQVKDAKKAFRGLEKIMVKTNSTSEQVLQKIQQKFPLRSKRVPPQTAAVRLDTIYILKVPANTDITDLCEELIRDPSVIYAHPNYLFRINFLPNDPFFSSSDSWGQDYDDLWGLKTIRSADAWDFSTGQGVTVAVIDTGIDYNHPDIKNNMWINSSEDINGNSVMDPDDINGLDDDSNGHIDDILGYNFANDSNDPVDDHGHGTHVAGTIAATGDNAIGVVGLAFRSQVMPVKALNDQGSGTSADLAEAIEYAANNGAEVINMSIGGPIKVWVIQDAIDYAYGQGVVLVASAGNNFGGDAAHTWPSAYENVISVASTDQHDIISDFSNVGVKIDVSAPGGGSINSNDPGKLGRNILSLRAFGTDMCGDGTCIVNEEYIRACGTSMAAPHVSALAALILSRHPGFTNEEIRQVMRTSADDTDSAGWDPTTGYGRINAYEALQIETIPTAKIIEPETNTNIGRAQIEILGTASSPNFEAYSLEYGSGINPSYWSLIDTSSVPVYNDILASWDTTLLPMGEYMLRLTVTGSGASVEDRILVTMSPELQAGFPIEMDDCNPVLTLTDIDHNGFPDIILNGLNSVDIYDFQGNSLSGWPLSFSNSNGVSAISAAELDPSYEGEELAFVIKEPGGNNFLHLYHADGTEITNGGWPKLISGYILKDSIIGGHAPILTDIDNDREPEIIQTSVVGEEWVGGIEYCRTTMQVWNFDGTLLQGQWPRTIITEKSAVNPSVGNIDDDEELEIAIGDKDGQLHIFNHDGSYLTGWPKIIVSDELLTTTMADIDRDAKAEIMVQARDGSVHIMNDDGSEVGGWPFAPLENEDFPIEVGTFTAIMPTAADLEQDGWIEIIMIYDRVIYVIGHDGIIKTGWPKYLPGGISGNTLNCAIGDLDGDFRQDIIITTAVSPQVYAFDMEGKKLPGWPAYLDASLAFTSSALTDLDRDGDIEILAVTVWPTKLYAFDYPKGGQGRRLDWPMLRSDAQHTQALIPLGDVNGDWKTYVRDIMCLVNIILEKPGYSIWRYPRSDVNQDNAVNVLDIQLVVNIILGVNVTF